MFIYGPSLLLEGERLSILWTVVTALVGIGMLAAAMERWFMGEQASWVQTVLLFAGAILLIKPGPITDLIGLVLLGVAFGLWAFRKRRLRAETEKEI